MRRKLQALLALSAGAALILYTVLSVNRTYQDETAQKDSITIHWFVALPEYSKTWNPEGNLSDAKILERTGVNLDIQSGSLADLDALIATDELPELITVEANVKERFILENSGMAAALEPLFEEYAPDVMIPESMKDWYRNSDGNWYAIASYYYGPERVNEEYGGYLEVHNNNYVRADLLAQTGISMQRLQTKEGMLSALRAVKDMEYEGQTIIPYTGWWTQSIAEQFGMQVEDENGQLLSAYRQPEWLEALLFGNQLYREGLMSAEQFTESTNQRRAQLESGRVFCCTGYANVKDAKDALKSRDNNASMEYTGHIRGEEGKQPNLKSVASEGWTATLVNADAENMERIIRFIAYMTEDEAILDAAPEIGAETYDIIDGRCVRRADVKQEFLENYEKAASKYYMNLEFFVDWTVIQKYQPKRERAIFESQYEGCQIFDSKALDAAYTIDSSSPMAEIKERIDAYYQNAEVVILTSESEEQCRQRYEETIAVMEEIGLCELEEYERMQYQSAKERMYVE